MHLWLRRQLVHSHRELTNCNPPAFVSAGISVCHPISDYPSFCRVTTKLAIYRISLNRFRDVLGGRTDVEVILDDNGSSDDTADVLAEELTRPGNAFGRTVSVDVNRGYGFGIMSGLRESRGDVLAWTHADMQTDPKDVLDAYEMFASREDLADSFLMGRRISRPLIDGLFTWGMSAVASVVLGVQTVRH